jgi:hypothetical protein
MDSKRHSGKQYASNVSFAPQQLLPKRLDSHSMDIQPLIVQSGKIRQDSLSGSVCNFNMKAAGRQGSITSPVAGQAKSQLQYQAFLDLNHAAVKCLFRARWRILSYLQITFGLLAVALSIYSKFINHYMLHILCNYIKLIYLFDHRKETIINCSLAPPIRYICSVVE